MTAWRQPRVRTHDAPRPTSTRSTSRGRPRSVRPEAIGWAASASGSCAN